MEHHHFCVVSVNDLCFRCNSSVAISKCTEFLAPYSQQWDGCSLPTYSVWSVISAVGYSCSALAVALRLLAHPVVRYRPKVSDAFGCWTQGSMSCGCPVFGFLLHARINRYLH